MASWLGKRFCTVKELESLVGKLQHASKVIQPGQTFMRRMFELLRGTRRGQRFVRLNARICSGGTIYGPLEWRCYDGQFEPRGLRSSSLLRCIWDLRMWGLVGRPVVPAPMASGEWLLIYSPERAPPHSISLHPVGGSMEGGTGDGSLLQHGSGGGSQLWLQQRRRISSAASCVILRQGSVGSED